MNVHIHPAAQQEHDEQIEYLAGVDEELALAFELRYLQYRHSIGENPLHFRLRKPPTRRANLTPRFGAYYIAFMIWQEKVVILAVAHGKRRPYYWRTRIGEARRMF